MRRWAALGVAMGEGLGPAAGARAAKGRGRGRARGRVRARGGRRHWRVRFLAGLARCANARLAAQMAGVDHSTAYLLRLRDPGFAAAWLRARDWGRARVEAEGRAVHSGGRPRGGRMAEPADPRPLVVRRSANAGAQLVRAGEGRWNPAAEEKYFDFLGAGHGIRRSANEAGFSAAAVYKRRDADPLFRARWDEARGHGRLRNETLLEDSVQWALDPEAIERIETLPVPTIREAIQIVRMGKPGGGAGGAESGGRAPVRREPSIEQVRDEIVERLAALRRQRAGKAA